jgi:hypothetical protein
MDGFRMVLVLGLFLGLGSIPLWSLVLPVRRGLGLVSRYLLGASLGELAIFRRLLRMGAIAACGPLDLRMGIPLQLVLRGGRLRVWPRLLRLLLRTA